MAKMEATWLRGRGIAWPLSCCLAGLSISNNAKGCFLRLMDLSGIDGSIMLSKRPSTFLMTTKKTC